MQARLFSKEQSTIVINQLMKWYAEGRDKMQPLVDYLKLIKLDQWAQIAAISNGSSASMVSVLEIVHRLIGKAAGADEALIRRITNERESAVNSYKQANQALLAGSFGLALTHINNAVDEFTSTPLTGSQKEVLADQQLKAEMYLLKAMIQLYLNKPKAAINALHVVVGIDNNMILAHNLLAHIYINVKNTSANAIHHLEKSISLASHQIFANYYLGKLNHDESKMRMAMDQLVNVFAQKERVGNGENHGSAWLNLQATTIPSMVLTVLTDWLDYSARQVNDPRTLATIANMGSILSEQPTEATVAHAERILEVRLLALSKLARLKAYAAEFESFDLEWRQSYGVALHGDGGVDRYFMAFPSYAVGSTVTRLFDKLDLSCLKNASMNEALSRVIAGWAMHGWLSLEETKEIHQAVKKMKHLSGHHREQAYNALLELCSTPEIISYFLDSYILVKNNWENIYKATRHDDKLYSVLHILCELSDINLCVYTKQNDALVLSLEDSKMTDEETMLGSTRINPKTKQTEALHVCYQPEESAFMTLESLDAPSRVYSRIALQDAWSLHRKNPNNATALGYLKRKGAANLLAGQSVNEAILVADDEPLLNVSPVREPSPPAVEQSTMRLFSKSLINDFVGPAIIFGGIAAINALARK